MSGDNPVLRSALDYQYNEPSEELGLDKIVAFGDESHKCPVYVERIPPCTNACPAGEDIRGMHNILRGTEEKKAENKWEAAFRRLTSFNPFPFVMGQVCPAPCQDGCNRQYLDETVGINTVEHAIGKYGIDNNLAYPKPDTKIDKSIGVVGSGPAGLSAAYQLAKRGYSVTIYESAAKPGGMMRYGTLGYRVSREGLEAEIQRILDLGIELKLNCFIGKDVSLDELRKRHDAVFIGVGAQKGRMVPIEGSEGSPRVIDTIAFLRDYEDNGHTDIGKNVAVIGDGDVAMDAARLSLRLGSKATIISGVPRDEMNCSAFEFDEASDEGTTFLYQTGTVKVNRDGDKVTGLTVTEMVKKEKGEDGWNSPVPFFRYKAKEGSEKTVEFDTVIFAVGQATDMTGLEATCNGTPWLNVDQNYQVKGMEDVFGGGDAIKIDLITTAIGHGRKAAESIVRFLNGEKQPSGVDRPDIVNYEMLKWDFFTESKRKRRGHRKVEKVEGDFDTILQVLESADIESESERCMSCGLCFECDQCMIYCPQEAIEKFKGNEPGEVMFTVYERCVGCHICAESCPTGYIDMAMGE